MNDTVIIIAMEVIGTIAFSLSGSLIAVKGSLDLFGVIFVGCITAVGGGIMRDILMGQFPPNIFSSTIYLAIAAVTSVLTFIFSYLNRKSFQDFRRKLEIVNNFFDAIGLAAFTVIGVEMAVHAEFSTYPVFAILMGFLTGTGGGMIRDILVDKTPNVLRKQIYAVASLFGGCLFYFIRNCFNETVAVFVSVPIIIVIRMMATRFHWRLPRIDFES